MTHGKKKVGNGHGKHEERGRPNILVIWGDDIGYWNISAYNQGMMGYHYCIRGEQAVKEPSASSLGFR